MSCCTAQPQKNIYFSADLVRFRSQERSRSREMGHLQWSPGSKAQAFVVISAVLPNSKCCFLKWVRLKGQAAGVRADGLFRLTLRAPFSCRSRTRSSALLRHGAIFLKQGRTFPPLCRTGGRRRVPGDPAWLDATVQQ